MPENIHRTKNVKFSLGYVRQCVCVTVTGEKCEVNGWSEDLSGSTMIRTVKKRNKTEHRHMFGTHKSPLELSVSLTR